MKPPSPSPNLPILAVLSAVCAAVTGIPLPLPLSSCEEEEAPLLDPALLSSIEDKLSTLAAPSRLASLESALERQAAILSRIEDTLAKSHAALLADHSAAEEKREAERKEKPSAVVLPWYSLQGGSAFLSHHLRLAFCPSPAVSPLLYALEREGTRMRLVFVEIRLPSLAFQEFVRFTSLSCEDEGGSLFFGSLGEPEIREECGFTFLLWPVSSPRPLYSPLANLRDMSTHLYFPYTRPRPANLAHTVVGIPFALRFHLREESSD